MTAQQAFAYLRPWALAVVAFFASFDPTGALRWGAIVCLVVLITRIIRVRMDGANVCAMALTLWYIISQNWAISAADTGLAIKNQLGLLAIFLAVRTCITNRRGLLTVAWGYLAGCLWCVHLMLQQKTGDGFVLDAPDSRLGLQGLNVNYSAYALAVGMTVTVLIWTRTQYKIIRVALLLGLVLIGVAVWHSETRGAITGVALLAIWVLLYRFGPKTMLNIAWIAVGIVAIAIATGIADTILHGVDADTIRSTGDLAGRLTIWPDAREVFATHFLTGIGAAGFQSVDPLAVGAHNIILELGSGLGIIGVGLFVGMFIFTLQDATRGADVKLRALLVGGLLLTTAPMYLSGHWELSPAGWIALAVFSRIQVLSEAPRICDRRQGGGRVVEDFVQPKVDLPSGLQRG